MSLFTGIIAAIALIVFVVVLTIVRVKEGHDEDDQLFEEARRKRESENYRSEYLSDAFNEMKDTMDWHNN